MDLDLYIKVFGLLISLGVPLKIILDRGDSNRRNLFHDFEITKNFFEYIQNAKNIHPLVLERGYHAVANDNTISRDEIEYLLSFKRPFFAISKYAKCRDIINYDDKRKLFFNKFYKLRKVRIFLKITSIVLYFTFAFSAIIVASSIFFSGKFNSNIAYNFLIIFPASCFLAYRSIQGYVLVKNSEILMKMQHEMILDNPVNE